MCVEQFQVEVAGLSAPTLVDIDGHDADQPQATGSSSEGALQRIRFSISWLSHSIRLVDLRWL